MSRSNSRSRNRKRNRRRGRGRRRCGSRKRRRRSSGRSRSRIGTWHADKRLAVDFVKAALAIDLAQVVAGTGVGVAGVNHLLHHVGVHRTGSWRNNRRYKLKFQSDLRLFIPNGAGSGCCASSVTAEVKLTAPTAVEKHISFFSI